MKVFLTLLFVVFFGDFIALAMNGGQSVESPKDFPYMAALFRANSLRCGASIISHYWVLTAAHCVLPDGSSNPELYTVRTSAIKYYDEGVRYSAERILTNKNYNYQDNHDDVALIKVSEFIPFNDTQDRITPACDYVGTKPGEVLRITGYGRTGTADHPNVLQQMRVPVVRSGRAARKVCEFIGNQERCRIPNNPADYVDKIETFDGQHDVCPGDSGSPVVLEEGGRKILVGVVSTGRACMLREPDQHIMVTSQWWWIKLRTENTPGDEEIVQYCPGDVNPSRNG